MHVVYYDVATKLPHGNARQVREFRELLRASDIVTLHVPSDATTRNMIDAGSANGRYETGDPPEL